MTLNYEKTLLNNLTNQVEMVKSKPEALTLFSTLSVWEYKLLKDSDPEVRSFGYKIQSLKLKLEKYILG